jgi:hypothetical protein
MWLWRWLGASTTLHGGRRLRRCSIEGTGCPRVTATVLGVAAAARVNDNQHEEAKVVPSRGCPTMRREKPLRFC